MLFGCDIKKMLANLLGGFIVILVGVNLIPTVANQVKGITDATDSVTTNSSNVSAAAQTLLDLTIIFYALGIMSAGVALAVGGLRSAGLV